MVVDLFPAGTMPPQEDIVRILPELILGTAGTVLMVLVPLFKDKLSAFFGNFSLATIVAAIVGALYASQVPGLAFSSLLIVDSFATFFRILVLAVGIRERPLLLSLPQARHRRNR